MSLEFTVASPLKSATRSPFWMLPSHAVRNAEMSLEVIDQIGRASCRERV